MIEILIDYWQLVVVFIVGGICLYILANNGGPCGK